MNKSPRQAAIAELEAQLEILRKQQDAHELLEAIWQELGPYTSHISNDLRYKLQDYFRFDDSE